MNYLEIIGTLVGLIYLWLEYKASIWLWVANVVMPAIYVMVYYKAGLYADFGISIYYLLVSFYGMFYWWKGRKRSGDGQMVAMEELPITHAPARLWAQLIVVSIALLVLIAFVLIQYTDSTVPWMDSLTTALSIVAMWMLARKYVEQWLVWIVVDAISAGLYIYKELYFTAGLYALYTVIAYFGYKEWRRLMKNA